MEDSIFGISGKALQLSEDRAVVLTNNLVNSATPHYKARDFDFHKMLQQADQQTVSMAATDQTSDIPVNSTETMNDSNLLYRVPIQQSLDGNTVDEEIERKDFLENALQYQVNLTFIQNQTSELMKAMKGD